MSGNSSISAAIRRRTSGVNVNTDVDNNIQKNNESRRVSYDAIVVNHERRLKDIEVLFSESLLPESKLTTDKFDMILKSIEELKNEVYDLKMLNTNSVETNEVSMETTDA